MSHGGRRGRSDEMSTHGANACTRWGLGLMDGNESGPFAGGANKVVSCL